MRINEQARDKAAVSNRLRRLRRLAEELEAAGWPAPEPADIRTIIAEKRKEESK